MRDHRSADASSYRASHPLAGALPILLLASALTTPACGDDITVVDTLGLVVLVDHEPAHPDHGSHEASPTINVGDFVHVKAAGNECFSSSCNRLVSSTCTMEVIDESTVTLEVRTVVEYVPDRSGFLGLVSTCSADCAQYPADCGRVEIGAEEIVFFDRDMEFGRLTFPRSLISSRLPW